LGDHTNYRYYQGTKQNKDRGRRSNKIKVLSGDQKNYIQYTVGRPNKIRPDL